MSSATNGSVQKSPNVSNEETRPSSSIQFKPHMGEWSLTKEENLVEDTSGDNGELSKIW